MKKNFMKKSMSVALASTMVLGLTACGGSTPADPNLSKTEDTAATTTTTEAAAEATTTAAPEETASATIVDKMTIMMDGTVFTEANGRAEFEAALEKVMEARQGSPCDITFIQPDHSGYYDVVSQTFANPDTTTWPDVVLLGSSYYSSYANNGVLADISGYWENSDVLASGRVKSEAVIDGLYIDGALYGIAPTRGNGCVTYVKKAWMDAAGITEAPKNYEEYTAMLQAFCDTYGTYAITSPGIVNNEAPYVNYLPEFFQDAYPDFYKTESGEWIDGFTEDKMVDALERLTEAYDNGWLDPECVTNKTSDCRDKFYADKCGVFTYWAGVWADNMATKLEAAGLDSELVPMEPIAEVGKYIERQAVTWCVTTKAENPNAIADLFFGTMLDGADGQVLWTYGVEDVHWSTKGESLTYADKTDTFEEGQFHFRINLETKDHLYTKHHMDKMLAVTDFVGEDIGNASAAQRAVESGEMFNANCEQAPVIVSNDVMAQYQSEIMSLRIQLVSEVVTNGLSIDDAMGRYTDEVGDKVGMVLDSLNN